MLIGIIAGFSAAFLQSCSYIFSRSFVLKHRNPLLLLIYAQLTMGVIALAALPFLVPPAECLISGKFWFLLFLSLGGLVAGQLSFYQAIREIEASRLSSLLGLKIIILAFFCLAIRHEPLRLLQYTAIAISAAAAMAMNWSGGRFTLKGCLWLLLSLSAFSVADITEYELIHMPQTGNLVLDAIGITMLSYVVLGFCTIPALFFVPRKAELARDAIPYSFVWLAAMAAIFACYGTLNVVFGNVVQSTRGIISVLLGLALTRFGFSSIEPPVGRKAWIRRFAAALLMLLAIFLYSWSAHSTAES